jgi:thiamine pyrophosphate-dependent acetolactate synthase large subunit-like protein
MRATYSIEGMMALENLIFVRIASAFGIQGKRVRTLGQLKKVFDDSVRWDEPFLLEFSGPVFAPPWRT